MNARNDFYSVPCVLVCSTTRVLPNLAASLARRKEEQVEFMLGGSQRSRRGSHGSRDFARLKLWTLPKFPESGGSRDSIPRRITRVLEDDRTVTRCDLRAPMLCLVQSLLLSRISVTLKAVRLITWSWLKLDLRNTRIPVSLKPSLVLYSLSFSPVVNEFVHWMQRRTLSCRVFSSERVVQGHVLIMNWLKSCSHIARD
ncbi:hypothetical protein MPTK1_5g15840 [Marchantia polymorpha subsp. ruderalis]|uniref:Uncharacterized protein n=2 Tax=Marchantia polymorpha TaxID=3197 RepID=A0AAF6BIS8_MARPO|nr:hypothetical protein MARPO_0071s0026 [Marchantia polymorpha]BBN11912.1 hypothetical protein Mp_5g15840 [Marchantia polymorpha subsp. ruderalis]|eukprot:PTQ35408.1 hypothetical protein MARPO_0071s0026 [Marchantia polymorpha]